MNMKELNRANEIAREIKVLNSRIKSLEKYRDDRTNIAIACFESPAMTKIDDDLMTNMLVEQILRFDDELRDLCEELEDL